MKYTNKTAEEIIDDLLENGFDFSQIRDFSCDGEAMAKSGITDQIIAEEIYEITSRPR